MSNSIDTKIIGKLAEILDKNQLTGLKYEDENCKISLSRELSAAGIISQAQYPAQVQVMPSPKAITPVEEEKEEEEIDYSSSPNTVKSPMVGVVYLSSNPDAPTYVKVGDNISTGDTVCLIEAMKTFNPVKAHKSGKVTKILVETGDPVEYGEPLVVIE